eukprot:TRINITY_DN5549_c0_g2_i3.p1 TRINITY_DN5549_c0_g2~~TRINITY_DN5549_c0_g2_i3.p1  ORF type:complete len:433 (+),score=25.60 TRINITY_DN5549_c0_g2_i3:80-1378(+)
MLLGGSTHARHGWMDVLGPSVCVGMALFGQSGFVAVAPSIVPESFVGPLVSLQGACSILTALVVGPSIDTLGTTRVLNYAFVLHAVSVFFSAISSTIAAQLVGRVACGTATTATLVACVSHVTETYEDPDRTQHMGTVFGTGTLGASLGPIAFGFAFSFSSEHGFSCPRAGAFMPLLGLIALSFFVRPRSVQHEGDDHSSKYFPVDASLGFRIFDYLFGVYRKVGVQAILLNILIFASFCLMSSLFCAASIKLHSLGVKAEAIGSIMSPAFAIQIVASPLVGRFSNTPARRWAFLAAGTGAFPCGILTVVLIYSGIPMFSTVISVILGLSALAVSCMRTPSISLLTEHGSVCGCGKGESVTAAEVAVASGLAVGPYMGEAIMRVIGVDGLCYVWALCCGLLALLVVPCVSSRQLSFPEDPTQKLPSCHEQLR